MMQRVEISGLGLEVCSLRSLALFSDEPKVDFERKRALERDREREGGRERKNLRLPATKLSVCLHRLQNRRDHLLQTGKEGRLMFSIV
jgi:hypothetical protein